MRLVTLSAGAGDGVYAFAETAATLGATMGVSADAAAAQEAVLADPNVQDAINAKTPDAVDKLIQGILEGKGHGGVVTSEFNKGGVHATIISNVNQLKVTQLDNSAEAKTKQQEEEARKAELRTKHKKTQERVNKQKSAAEAEKKKRS